MRNKVIMVSIIALFAVVFALNAVMATSSDFVSIDRIESNGVVLNAGSTYIGKVSNTIPVEIEFTANEDISEIVKVQASIEGPFKDDIEETVLLDTPLKAGVKGYTARFSLKLPSTMDIDGLNEDVYLNIEIKTSGKIVTDSRTIKVSRNLYNLDIQSVDAPETVVSGSVIAVDVVLQNNGNERLDNTYVKASIPALGIERKVYFGDLSPIEEIDQEDIMNTVNKKLYLTIPKNAVPGVYNLEIEAYNYDTSVVSKKKIVISEVEIGVMPSLTSKTISTGEETTFNVVLVNPNDRMVVYTLTPGESKGLTVDISEPVVAVPADSSKTVTVSVKATNSAEEGSHLVTVDVNSDSGLVKKVNFNLNVEKASAVTPIIAQNNVVLILTVILVIIFVVLLIVLIVLLSKKPAESEEFGETSYY